MEQIESYIALALSAIALFGIVYNWFTAGEKKVAKDLANFISAHRDKHEEIDRENSAMDRRIQRCEDELKHLPDQKAVHELALALKDMQAEIAKIGASADQSARTSKRIEEYLLAEKKSRS
jgi:ABC-type phosphate transport system auxiliary subunit